jgi:anti-sigma regulatory factor (Ser/Thr protein kinase)/CBS domain-containing protein
MKGSFIQETMMTEPSAAGNGSQHVTLFQVLAYELRVRDAMSQPAHTASPEDTLRTIQGMMKTHRISGVPIVSQGKLSGVVSIEDIINALDLGHINEPASKWMTRNVAVLRDHYSIARAVSDFDRFGYGRFPVLDAHDNLVGVITQGDITTCLMKHIEKRAEEALAHEAVLVADRQADDKARRVVVRVKVRPADFEQAGRLSAKMRQVLRERGVDPEIRRRAAVVAYEAETNIIIHSLGGLLTATIYPDKIHIEAVDEGPGIEHLEHAMKEGWSTAGPLARSLGFGAGMGLPNMKRCSDRFDITSAMGTGTRLVSEIAIGKPVGAPPAPAPETKTIHETPVIVTDDSG